MSNLSIKRKLVLYSIVIQFLVLIIFSFALYKSLEITTLDKIQANLKVIILDVTDDILEHQNISDKTLDEDIEYMMDPLYIRVMEATKHKTISKTPNYPDNIIHDDDYLETLEKEIITFEEQNNYLVSRIKINFHKQNDIIVEVATTKEILSSTLEDLLYILYFILPIILIFSILGGNFIIYKSFLPIEQILNQLKRINANDLSERIKSTNTNDEIDSLILEINSLLERIEESFQRVSQFSSDASHELKTPLTIIRGEIEIALRKDRDIDEYKSTLQTSLDEILTIEQTINDLLFLAKNENEIMIDKMQNYYIDEIIDESINEVKNLAKLHNINIILDLKDSVEFNCYANLIKIALKNILKNAIQYSYKDSKIIVKGNKNNSFFEISVQDFGIGIEKNKQNKIFEKFYRTDKSRNKNSGGTGLGMSIVRKIVDIHNGDIKIQSNEDIGTTITLILALEK
ncbi:sensor histidine kinase [Malaciobacter pacificus]|jgi:heavy metal sensor kinase|uniref:histidine kinase n=1 Tax=Malaciobacter pacificus TaxID=1080223 RepID=A0A5C2H9Y0_9BACT|nr:ATP-binding protein [Malaciobacter pacificus]QEP33634.1 two-component system sensor histidine kinase [Malaciobacter pacificus]